MTQESLEEKTLTPNEIAKKEEIVKSLKKKRSDFVKRYGADRAKAVMYAVATKTAKAVTEESLEELDEVTDVKTKKQIQREHLEQTGEFLSLSEINLDERIEMPQGHKYTADPISKASENGRGHKKPQMGTKTNTAASVAAILKKTKE